MKTTELPILRHGRPTGAVAHAGVIRALYGLATGWDPRAELVALNIAL